MYVVKNVNSMPLTKSESFPTPDLLAILYNIHIFSYAKFILYFGFSTHSIRLFIHVPISYYFKKLYNTFEYLLFYFKIFLAVFFLITLPNSPDNQLV